MSRIILLVVAAALLPLAFAQLPVPGSSPGTPAVVNISQEAAGLPYCASTSKTDTYVCPDNTVTVLDTGSVLVFKPTVANTGAATIDPDGSGSLTAKSVKMISGGSLIDPPDNTFVPSGIYQLVYDGTYYVVQSAQSGVTTPTQQYGDFWIVRSDSTHLVIGQNCATATPCRVQFGVEAPVNITASGTVTASAGDGSVYIYTDSASGRISVGHTGLTLSCDAGCDVVAAISAFPADSIPLWQWTVSSGAFSVGGGTDYRSVTQKGAEPNAYYLVTRTQSSPKNARLYKGTANISVASPAAGDSGLYQFMVPLAVTITRVACSVKTGTSATINLDERVATTPDTAGTDVLSSGLVCDTNQQTSCSSGCDVDTITNSGIAARVPVALTISAVSGTPDALRVFVEYTISE